MWNSFTPNLVTACDSSQTCDCNKGWDAAPALAAHAQEARHLRRAAPVPHGVHQVAAPRAQHLLLAGQPLQGRRSARAGAGAISSARARCLASDIAFHARRPPRPGLPARARARAASSRRARRRSVRGRPRFPDRGCRLIWRRGRVHCQVCFRAGCGRQAPRGGKTLQLAAQVAQVVPVPVLPPRPSALQPAAELNDSVTAPSATTGPAVQEEQPKSMAARMQAAQRRAAHMG